ncbi:MAG: Grx4 family monothiol glutaredoxin, partial [Acetobacter papayae]
MTDSATQAIQQEIDSNPVMLFMKGDADFPQCGFSARVVQILNHLGVPFKTANVLADPSIRQGIKDFSNWPTIPQLYVKGEFIGGCDIV